MQTDQKGISVATRSLSRVQMRRRIYVLFLTAIAFALVLPWISATTKGQQVIFRAPLTQTVILGVTGISWDDVDFTQLPTLRKVANVRGSVLTATGATITCPTDAWISVGALSKVVDRPGRARGHCRPLSDMPIQAYPSIVRSFRDNHIVNHWGSLGLLIDNPLPVASSDQDIVAGRPKANRKVLNAPLLVAIGDGAHWAFPKAPMMLTDEPLSQWIRKRTTMMWMPARSDLSAQIKGALTLGTNTVLVDAGGVNQTFATPISLRRSPADGFPRFASTPVRYKIEAMHLLKRIDSMVANILLTHPKTNVVVASIGDVAPQRSAGIYLARTAATTVNANNADAAFTTMLTGEATSFSTQRRRFITTADIGATILNAVHKSTPARLFHFNDAFPITAVEGITPSLMQLQSDLSHVKAAGPARLRTLTIWLINSFLLAGMLVALHAAYRKYGKRWQLRLTNAVALMAIIHVGAIPGSILSNADSWWLAAPTEPGNEWLLSLRLALDCALAGALITALAFTTAVIAKNESFVSPLSVLPAKKRRFQISARSLAIHTGVWIVVIVTTSPLSPWLTNDSLFRSDSVSGSRLLGLGNNLLGTTLAALLSIICIMLAQPLSRRKPIPLSPLVGMMLVMCPVIVAASWGILAVNFGAIPPLVATAVLTVGILSRRQVVLTDVLWSGAITLAMWISVGFADYWIGPTNHIGRFVGNLFTANASAIVARKIGLLADTVGGTIGLIILGLLSVATIVTIALYGRRRLPNALIPIYRKLVPLLDGFTPLLVLAGVSLLAAIVLNDSGLLIVLYVAATALPLLMAARRLRAPSKRKDAAI